MSQCYFSRGCCGEQWGGIAPARLCRGSADPRPSLNLKGATGNKHVPMVLVGFDGARQFGEGWQQGMALCKEPSWARRHRAVGAQLGLGAPWHLPPAPHPIPAQTCLHFPFSA